MYLVVYMFQVSHLVSAMRSYFQSEQIKRCYLPLFNLGKYEPFQALTVGLFKQLKEHLKERDPNAVSTVFMKEFNATGDEDSVSVND